MSFEKFCSNCGVDMIKKEPHKETCQKYLKQWAFVFHKNSNEEHTEIYYGNTEEQAKKDMLKWYQDAVNEAEEQGIENSSLFNELDEIKETGEIIKFD